MFTYRHVGKYLPSQNLYGKRLCQSPSIHHLTCKWICSTTSTYHRTYCLLSILVDIRHILNSCDPVGISYGWFSASISGISLSGNGESLRSAQATNLPESPGPKCQIQDLCLGMSTSPLERMQSWRLRLMPTFFALTIKRISCSSDWAKIIFGPTSALRDDFGFAAF